MHLIGENCQNLTFEGKNLKEMGKWSQDRIYNSEKIWTPGAGLPTPPGNIYVYYHNNKKIFFSETARPIEAKLHVEHPSGRGTKVYING